MNTLGSESSIPGAFFSDNRLDEHAGNFAIEPSPSGLRHAGNGIPTRMSPKTPPPRARPFPTPTAGLPALRPAIFASPVKSPVVVIKTIKQIPSQAYADVPLLDKSQCNWDLWNRKLRIVLEGCGLDDYVYGLLPRPSDPRESVTAWIRNDKLARSFILSRCSDEEQRLIEDIGSSSTAYQYLKLRHEREGAYTQLILIQEAFTLRFARSTRLATSFNITKDLVKRIFNIGFPSQDSFLRVILLNMLQADFSGLRDQIATAMSAATPATPYTSNDILKRLELEQQLLDGTSRPVDTALLAAPRGRQPTSNKLCTNCNRTGHLIATCWREGGGMAGRRDEILAEKLKKRTNPAKPSSSSTATTSKSGTRYDQAGRAFILDADGYAVYLANHDTPSASVTPPTSSSSSDAAALLAAFPDQQFADFEVFLASTDDLAATVNWNSPSIAGLPCPDVETFILDTGATTHISFCRSDFDQLTAIAPRTVCGVGGSRISAVGVGTIHLQLGDSVGLVLRHVLYVPTSQVRLISIPALCDDDQYVATFDSRSCTIRTHDSILVATGLKTGNRALYHLRCKPIFVHHAHVAQRASSLATWHRRLGHINYDCIVRLARHGLASGMHVDLSALPPKCDHCFLGKQTRNPVPKVREGKRASRCLEKVFVDLTGPFMTTPSGFSYVMHVVDDFSSFVWSIPLRDKSSAFPALCAWQGLREAETSLKVGTYRTDRGELRSHQMESWLSSCAAKQEFTAPYTSAQNGRCERAHLTIMNLARTMRISCGLPENRWDEFTKTAAYLLVRTPVSTLHNRTPFEAFYGHKPDLSHLREIGARAFVLHNIPTNGKISARSFECVLVGYAANSKAYRCYHRPTHRILESFHVRFIESEDSISRPLYPGVVISLPPAADPATPVVPPSLSLPKTTDPVAPSSPRRSARLRGIAANPIALQLACLDPAARDPLSLGEARRSADWPLWASALEEEFASIKAMNVYRLVPREMVPNGRKILQGKPVFRIKRDEHGIPSHFKARWVLKGYEQVEGLDYVDTHSPTARSESFRIGLHIAASMDWEMQNFDIKTAFLHGELSKEETCWMEQPPGFEEPGKDDHVWELLKALYGMKQAGRVWNKTLNEAMLNWGFVRLPCEYCVYYRSTAEGTIIAIVHVDDFLSVASSKEENERFKAQLRERWEISEGDASFMLGMRIERDRVNRTISISQEAFIDKILAEFNLTDANPVKVPMNPGLRLRQPLNLSPAEKVELSKIPYRRLVCSMGYLSSMTRPDIAKTYQDLSQFLCSYDHTHWEAAKHCARYLKGTKSQRLILGGKEPIVLRGYCDSSYGSCPDSAKSVSGYTFNLGSGPISWAARKQKTVALSSCEAKYVAASEAGKEVAWLRQLLAGIGFPQTEPTIMRADNNGAICLSNDPSFHARAKHIHVRYHYIRELVQDNIIKLKYICTKDNLADIFTKPLELQPFTKLRNLLHLMTVHSVEEEC